MDIQIAKGTSKTFKLVADTSSLNEDTDTFGVALNVSTVTNIKWNEYFSTGYAGGINGSLLSEFPINGGLDTNY
jgi:hypothetical protein